MALGDVVQGGFGEDGGTQREEGRSRQDFSENIGDLVLGWYLHKDVFCSQFVNHPLNH